MKKRLIEDSIECNFMDSPHSKDPVYHSHTKYEMLLILNDNISMLINGQKYDVPFGTLVLLTNHDLHLVTNNNGNNKMFKRIAIHFSPDLIRTYSTPNTDLLACFHHRSSDLNCLLTLGNDDIGTFIELAAKFCPYWKSKRYGEDVLSVTYLIQILIMVNYAYAHGKAVVPVPFTDLVRDIISYIDQHLDEELKISSLAKAFSYSENYICTQFARQTSITLKQYILTKKLATAKEYLESGYSVTKVAELCGFNDYTNFIRTFKNHIGCSPTQWVKTKNL
jgi:AraC-like DNA-binding protein